MPEEQKKSTTASEVREALGKTQRALKRVEEQTEQKFGRVLRGGLTQVVGFGAGALHEQFGEMDKRLGQKVIRVGGINAGAMVGAGGIIGALFDVGGKYAEEVLSTTSGVGAQAWGDFGRGFIKQLAARKEERKTEDAKKTAAEQAAKAKNENGAAAPAQATGT